MRTAEYVRSLQARKAELQAETAMHRAEAVEVLASIGRNLTEKTTGWRAMAARAAPAAAASVPLALYALKRAAPRLAGPAVVWKLAPLALGAWRRWRSAGGAGGSAGGAGGSAGGAGGSAGGAG